MIQRFQIVSVMLSILAFSCSHQPTSAFTLLPPTNVAGHHSTKLFMTVDPSSSTTESSSRRSLLVGSASFLASATTAAFLSTPNTLAATPSIDLSTVGGSIQYGDGSTLMSQKEHGTSHQPVQSNLMYGVSNKLADQICNFNRHFAEPGGYYTSTNFEEIVKSANGKPIAFYDSVTGKQLFVAPIGRSADEFLAESRSHGWPSFRDNEVVWDNVRVLRNSGETVSVDGVHLGHNLPDRKGNRYCINLVSIAGQPTNRS